MLLRTLTTPENCQLTLNKEGQVLYIDVPEADGSESQLHATIPKNYNTNFVSCGTLIMKAKQFDDGLYAAAELMTQEGTAAFIGKNRLLHELSARLPFPANEATGEVAESIFSACALGRVDASIP